MRKLLHSFQTKIFLALLAATLSNNFHAKAEKDSCMASYYWVSDVNDPLLIHFYFNGTVPANSFTFLGSWDFGDGFTSADSCPNHQFSQPGNYTVCLIFSICIGGGLSCHDDTCISITVGNIQSITNPDGALHTFYSYPNPVHSNFFIRTDALTKDITVKIKSVSGKEVFNSVVKNDSPVDASSFANGMYFIEASDGERTLTRKMIVERQK